MTASKPSAVALRAIEQTERYAKSVHTTPEEHDHIMVVCEIARAALASTPTPQAPVATDNDANGYRDAMRYALARECLDAIADGEGDAPTMAQQTIDIIDWTYPENAFPAPQPPATEPMRFTVRRSPETLAHLIEVYEAIDRVDEAELLRAFSLTAEQDIACDAIENAIQHALSPSEERPTPTDTLREVERLRDLAQQIADRSHAMCGRYHDDLRCLANATQAEEIVAALQASPVAGTGGGE